MHLQAVCDHKGIFTHCFVGHVGSVHDARVFRLSRLYDYLGDALKFPNDSHIIGDSAYALHTNLLTPFADNGHLTRRQKNFNFCHSSARMVIERTFGLLKGRWRSFLNELVMWNVSLIPYHVMAACVLHNICQLRRDAIPNVVVAERVVEDQPFGRVVEEDRVVAVEKRNIISAALVLRNVWNQINKNK
ncbi:protein ALP1-like [Ischnura elegans]|uniref:protein ALP1-like n=1 Tax=Ischnura elegans TaxID=197161 RepID=UPI001ED898B8|nr:protein ALP1-like [Ischnura elegans]XP_046403860.1 protein ALP1-like [Ischnura elegans]